VANEIIKLSQEFNTVNWHFIGCKPWFCSFMPKGSFSYQPPLDLVQYFSFIKSIPTPMAFIVPLVNNDFNVAKSNIAYMEASMVGSMTFAQDLPEFNVPGCAKFATASEFHNKMRQLINGKVNVMEHVLQSQEYIRNNLLLNQINNLRIDIFKKLLKME
jgi:hypothetical protein